MVSEVHTAACNAQYPGFSAATSDRAVLLEPGFQSIPPERVGLHGEYDHSGLTKRVESAFQAIFSSEALAAMVITQRGGVVVLRGQVLSCFVLDQMVETALGVRGATYVETHGVSIVS